MGNNKRDIDETIRIFAPPFVYYLISLFVQGIAFAVLFIKETRKVNTEYSAFEASNSFMEKLFNNIERNSYIIVFVTALIGMIFFGRIFYKDCKNAKDFDIFNWKKKLKINDVVIIIVFAMCIGTGVSRFVMLLPIDNIIGSYADVSNNLIKGNLIFQIISIGIFVPITEEIVYRGLLYKRLKMVTNVKISSIITSLMFGFFHFNLVQGIYTFLLSFVLIYVMDRYKSILPSIIIHMVVNMTALFGNYLAVTDKINESIIAYILIMSVELVIAGFLFIVFIVKDEYEDIKKDF